MLVERIIGALTFRREVYAEVEHDTDFTTTAWILVVAVTFLSQLGMHASRDILNWLIATVVGTIFTVLGFALAAFATSWAGRTLFNADAPFEEMVRTMGLAYVWNVVGVIGVVAVISTTLTCVLAPITCIAPILGLVSWFIAVKESLDLEWGPTIVSVVIGWVIQMAITFVAGIVLGLMGITAGAVGGFLGQ